MERNQMKSNAVQCWCNYHEIMHKNQRDYNLSKCHLASCLLCIIVFFFLILGDPTCPPATAAAAVAVFGADIVVVVVVVVVIISFQCSRADPRANM